MNYADASAVIGSDVTLQICEGGISVYDTLSTSPITIKGTAVTALTYESSSYEGTYSGSYEAEEGGIVFIAPGSAGTTAGTDTVVSDTASSVTDISSLPTTTGAAGYAALDPATQDALFANGIGVLSTAESNAYITSIGVEGWEVHFWAEGLPAATLGVVDAAGSPVTITNASLITVNGMQYLNFESTGAAAYALTSEEEAGLMQSVFGVAGIAVNGTPITTLW